MAVLVRVELIVIPKRQHHRTDEDDFFVGGREWAWKVGFMYLPYGIERETRRHHLYRTRGDPFRARRSLSGSTFRIMKLESQRFYLSERAAGSKRACGICVRVDMYRCLKLYGSAMFRNLLLLL